MFAFEPNICVVMLASKMTESRPTRARGLKRTSHSVRASQRGRSRPMRAHAFDQSDLPNAPQPVRALCITEQVEKSRC